jgi:hypothetical protein
MRYEIALLVMGILFLIMVVPILLSSVDSDDEPFCVDRDKQIVQWVSYNISDTFLSYCLFWPIRSSHDNLTLNRYLNTLRL